MANETTTTSANDIVISQRILTALMRTSIEGSQFARFARDLDLRADTSPRTAQIAKITNTSASGTVTDFSEGDSDLTPVEITTENSQVSVGIVAFAYKITDQLRTGNVLGSARTVGEFTRFADQNLRAQADWDMASLFGSATGSVSDSGSDLELADLLEARVVVRENLNYHFEDNWGVYCLNSRQYSDADKAGMSGTGVLLDQYYDRNRKEFAGSPLVHSTLTRVVNGGSDVEGAFLIRGDIPAAEPSAAIGRAVKRDLQVERRRNELSFTDTYVASWDIGWGMLQADAACSIVTDAPE